MAISARTSKAPQASITITPQVEGLALRQKRGGFASVIAFSQAEVITTTVTRLAESKAGQTREVAGETGGAAIRCGAPA